VRIQAYLKGFIVRSRLIHKQKPSKKIADFTIMNEVKVGLVNSIFVLVKQFNDPLVYKIILLNKNSPKRDDIFMFKTFRLPHNLNSESEVRDFTQTFTEKLRIIWASVPNSESKRI